MGSRRQQWDKSRARNEMVGNVGRIADGVRRDKQTLVVIRRTSGIHSGRIVHVSWASLIPTKTMNPHSDRESTCKCRDGDRSDSSVPLLRHLIRRVTDYVP